MIFPNLKNEIQFHGKDFPTSSFQIFPVYEPPQAPIIASAKLYLVLVISRRVICLVVYVRIYIL